MKKYFPLIFNLPDILFLYGQFFLIFLGLSFIIPVLGFFCGLPLNAVYCPLCFLLSALFTYYTGKESFNYRFLLIHLLIATLLIAGAVFLSIFILDTSWDGQWYHQAIIIRLHDGWNPFHNPVYPVDHYDLTNYIWVQHYPKCYHIIAACLYSFTDHIESGKAINIIAVYSLFFYSSYFIKKAIGGKRVINIFLSMLIALNPVTTSQIFSFYVDGFLGALIGILLIQFLAFELVEDRYRKWRWNTVLLLIVLICNIKFTGILISGSLIAIYSLYWWITRKKTVFIFQRYVLIGIAYILALVVFGYNPYVTNYREKGNPLYPTNDKAIRQSIMQSEPKVFVGKSTGTKLLISLFNKSSNDIRDSTFRWRNPFAVTATELRLFAGTDLRIGGMGPFFLLSLLLSVVLLVTSLSGMPYQEKLLLTILLAGIIFSVLIFEYSWWARYSPQIYWLVLFILIFTLRYSPGSRYKMISIISYTTIIVLVLNIGIIFSVYFGSNIVKNRLIREELSALGNIQSDSIIFNFSNTDFQSSRVRLKEAGIHFTESDTLVAGTKELRTIYKLDGFGPKYKIQPQK
ncbi:MAG: hypothetical protein J0H74_31135 [Chitinophagaceae bacterium]|nr:hypothetical protein [Chitinophagaceae bacterium]